jgi:hypothetical protein
MSVQGIGRSVWNLAELAPYRQGWAARCRRYAAYRAYYHGTAYEKVKGHAQARQLYEGTRTLFSPLRRCVRVDTAKVPAGWALPEQTSTATLDLVREVRQAHHLERAFGRFVLYGAVAGEAALLLSGSPEWPDVLALRPDEVQRGELADGTPFALIVKPQTGRDGRYEYAQLITPERVSTYKDGILHDYDGEGAERPNIFGRITLVDSPYLEGEDGVGEPAFGGVLELLDRVNESASLTLDVINRNAEPLVVGTGVSEVALAEGEDMLTVESPDAKFYTIDPRLAIGETLEFIREVKAEYKTLLPQLALDQLHGMSDLAYETVQTLLQELSDHIVAVRSSVDRAVSTVEGWLLEYAIGETPDDYQLWRERRWMALSEQAQLDLELRRTDLEQRRRALAAAG